MSISIIWDPRSELANVAGTLEVATVDEFRTYMESLTSGHGRHIRLDLSGVSFLDSSGLRELLRLSRSLGARAGSLAIGSASPAVRRLMAQTGVDEALLLADDQQPTA